MAAEDDQLRRKEVLRIGYVRTTSPYDLPCAVNPDTIMTCQKIGVVGEIFKTIAIKLNYKLQFVRTDDYGDRPNPDGRWPGLTGMLINGTIDATNGLWMTNDLLRVIKFTVPIASTDTGIVAGRLLSADADAPMDFTVFSLPIYVIFIPILLATALVLKAANGASMAECIWRAFAIFLWKDKDRAIHPIIQIGFLLFVLNYFANFRGQRLISALQTVVPTPEIENDLRNGRLRLVARHPAVLKAYMLKEVYGTADPYTDTSFPPLIEPSNARIVELLCANANLLYYGDILALFSGDQPLDRQCQLSRFSPTLSSINECSNVLASAGIDDWAGGYESTTLSDERMKQSVDVNTASPLSFSAQWGLGIRPDFDNKRLAEINAIIQRVFSPSMLQNYYFKQYSSAAATDPNAAPVLPEPNPIIGMGQLRYAFYFYCAGISLALASAVAEKLFMRKRRTYFINAEESIDRNWSMYSIDTESGYNTIIHEDL